jgi:hypothetical protein
MSGIMLVVTARQTSRVTFHPCRPNPCACTGNSLPIADAHTVTLKQLLAFHKVQQQQQQQQQQQNEQPQNGKSGVLQHGNSRSHSSHMPLYIRRALPGIHAHEYNQMIKSPFFRLTRAYVCEAAAVTLLRMSLEVRHSEFCQFCPACYIDWVLSGIADFPVAM